MFAQARAVTYATLFIGVLLVFVPRRILAWTGVDGPTGGGASELAGIAVCVVGGALALWCILAFAFVGNGTPAPFDPPRSLVVRGPYRFVRNPMYLGAVLVLSGAALVYHSLALLGYAAGFLIATYVFVVAYEEPTLGQLFGDDYRAYRARVRRWWPRA